MLAISGMKKMFECPVKEASDPVNCSVDINYEKICLDEYDTNIKSFMPNSLSNKEKVERLINCMQMKREMQTLSQTNKDSHTSVKCDKHIGASFQNRFLAQKNIIDVQRTKLLEQEKIINNLKMGTHSNEDIHKNHKYEIGELFHDCKMKLIGKVPLNYIPKNQGLLVKTQKAPRIIQELKERELERMKYREIIKERRKKLEDTKKHLQENSRKYQMEEEEKLKHLEMLKERHRKERQKMKIRQINKENFQENMNRAIIFYERKIQERLFSRWKCYYIFFLNNKKMSEQYCRRKILKKFFWKLLDLRQSKYSAKCEIASGFQRKLLLKISWRNFKENYMDRIRSWQVAEDFNDFLAQRKVLRYLFRFTSKQKILEDIKTHQACFHYQRKLMFSSFFHWMSLPIVLKMEKVKEERKQKWRKKVLEILPDFNPTEI